MAESCQKMEQDTWLFLQDSIVIWQDACKKPGSFWYNDCHIYQEVRMLLAN